MMQCEILRDGKKCENEASWLYESAYVKRVICDGCVEAYMVTLPPRTGSRVRKLTDIVYTCDWPVDNDACGKPARWFSDVDGVHRPLCNDCAVDGGRAIQFIDPRKVPSKPAPQVVEKKTVDADEMWARAQDAKLIAAMKATPVSSTPSKPSLRDAFEEFAVTLLEAATKKIEDAWKK